MGFKMKNKLMTSRIKKIQLQESIESQLLSFITGDYWLLNVPYHPNVGDTLIWQGELDFLKKIPYKCKGMRSFYSPIPTDIVKEDLILIHGGGNFGDLWTLPQDWQMNVVRKYLDNKILFFPQTVWFENEKNLKECAELLSEHKHLTICARDEYSYKVLTKNFTNKILLVPDMAFCIDMTKWKTCLISMDTLLLKRGDRELKVTQELEEIENATNVTIADWQTFTENSWQKKWFRRVKKYLPIFPRIYDWYAYTIFRPYLINSGIRLISSHRKIISTRLHAIILCILLGRDEDMLWLDNSYGKNWQFYETWLSDAEGITFVR